MVKINPLEIQIIAFEEGHAEAFKKINEEWINKYFTIEEEDRKLLDHPMENIINKGGYIILAVKGDEVVGTCALIPMDDPIYDFEIGKMAVSPVARGNGIGRRLGEIIIEKARALGAKKIYLETNAVLETAVKLYYKLGFVDINDHQSPYARCNIQMGLSLLK